MDTEDEKILACAKASHSVMVAYCRAVGDHSVKPWDEADGWQRESTIDMVRCVVNGVYDPREHHARWLDSKLRAGYVYGPEKNDDPGTGPLTNPNIMQYDRIPFFQRMKDNLHVLVTAAVASHYGLALGGGLDFFSVPAAVPPAPDPGWELALVRSRDHVLDGRTVRVVRRDSRSVVVRVLDDFDVGFVSYSAGEEFVLSPSQVQVADGSRDRLT